MADTELFVSHAPEDYERVAELVGPVRNLPIDMYIAEDVVESNRTRAQIKRRLANSDLAIMVLTSNGATNQWVNQEIGYATAEEVPIIPLVDTGVTQPGYITTDSITMHPDRPEETVFELLSRLREELEPIGELTTPGWFLSFTCTNQDCASTVILAIERRQHELWKEYEHGNTVTAICEDCGAAYDFNPATLGYIERTDR